MISLFQALVLGVVQGLTEFLPISSTAHLTFAEDWFRIAPEARITFDVVLHLGTTLALIFFFLGRLGRLLADLFSPHRESRRASWRLILLILLGSIPVAIIGFLLRKRIDTFFADSGFSALFLLVTGGVLFFTRATQGQRREPTWFDALVIGSAQAVSLLPGISRSGVTISAALFLGLARAPAFEFSFLLSIPAIVGAALFTLSNILTSHAGSGVQGFIPAAAGVAASLVVGLVALYLVRGALLARRFHLFALYCWLVGLVMLLSRAW